MFGFIEFEYKLIYYADFVKWLELQKVAIIRTNI